jgi:hypothetical protein
MKATSTMYKCPNARHGCEKQYGRKSSVINHHKTCQYNIAKASARSGHRFVTVVDIEDEDHVQPPAIGAPAVRARSTSDKTELELREFVNGTDVMGEFAKLPPGVAVKTRAIMGMCDVASDNISVAAVKRGLKRAQNEVLFHEYGLKFRANERAIEASLTRQRLEVEDNERRRKAKYEEQVSELKEDLDITTYTSSNSGWGLSSIFGSGSSS